MKISFQSGDKRWTCETNSGKCISIRQTFTNQQPNHFGATPAKKNVVRIGRFVGATRLGGACNVDELTMIPHCNGTHTESIFHIIDSENIATPPTPPVLMLAQLITVQPIPAAEQTESYIPQLDSNDLVINSIMLQEKLLVDNHSAIIIRTLPNTDQKNVCRYGEDCQPAFFTVEAMSFLSARFEHLLVDLPSLDRLHDEGLLTNHHIFWNVPRSSEQSIGNIRPERTITEMVFVDDSISDDTYLVNLQVPDLATDAVPARVLIFPTTPTQ